MFQVHSAIPRLEVIDDPFLHQAGVRLEVLRLDQTHPLVNGNKWFKLKKNLQQACLEGHTRLLSFGGAYSNHLRALAATAKLAGIRSIGVVRGEITQPLNPVLAFARRQGMELHPVSRSEYRHRNEPEFIEELKVRFGDFYLIPEGGSNRLGVEGCAEIMGYLEADLMESCFSRNIVSVACGTGATLAGLIRGAQSRHLEVDCLGVAVLKGADFLNTDVGQWLEPQHDCIDWQVNTAFHFGGYARSTPELDGFIARFHERTGVQLEPVYTGKLVFALYRLIDLGVIKRGSRVIWLHTGGIH